MTDHLVEQLYQCAEVLSGSNVKFENHAMEYQTILGGVKGSNQSKRLSSQFIARFFSKFPNLANESLDAILDLCEDDDMTIRKQAIKDLPMLCRDIKEFLPKIADVLVQLLQTQDETELAVIQNSLVSLFRKDPKGTLIGLFSQIKNGGDLVRQRAIKFLHLKIKTEGNELLDKHAESILISEIKKTLPDCTAEEFHMFMTILGMTKLPTTISGQNELAETAMAMAELDKPFLYHNKEVVDRLIQCGETAVKFFSERVASTRFFQYMCLSVMPNFGNMGMESEAQTRILKLLANLASYTGNIPAESSTIAAQNIYETLICYMPLPPEDVELSNDSSNTEFEFTKVECLLFSFHTIGKQAPDFLTSDVERLKDFKIRLQYFARGNMGVMKKLKEFLTGKSVSDMKEEANKRKAMALKTTSNIATLIKDLFHSPPSYKAKITLSWNQTQNKAAVALKRKSITFDVSPPKKTKSSNATSPRGGVYTPPTGKYSAGVASYSERGGRRGGKRRGGKFY